jgi:hypothetical protein
MISAVYLADLSDAEWEVYTNPAGFGIPVVEEQ